jgi:hypothetical protein
VLSDDSRSFEWEQLMRNILFTNDMCLLWICFKGAC